MARGQVGPGNEDTEPPQLTEAAFAHAQRLGEPLIVLMPDVDHFKQINDVHGHAAGDRMLADLAQSCREHIRPDDIAGRYGCWRPYEDTEQAVALSR